MFVIRNQGFFYTDEYYAPDGPKVRVLKETYDTREQAEAALATYNRSRLRQERFSDYLFDNPKPIAAVTALMREHFPKAYDYGQDFWFFEQQAMLPSEATDAQVDAILAASEIVFAEVFEYESEVDDVEFDPMSLEEFYFGPEAEEALLGDLD